jgi:hypothetical protein|tara:strand:+ start:627 stop:1214 length:588 start_codon:yes stop_codon:yes gene_type:complete
MTATEGVLQEIALVEVQAISGTAYQFAAIVEEITPEMGDRDGEGVVMLSGARLWKKTPQPDYEITLKIYPTDTRFAYSKDLIQGFFNIDANWSTVTSPTDTISTNQEDFRVVILYSDDTTMTAASRATTAGNLSRRLTFKHARMVSYKESFDDKVVSAEVKFKGPAFHTDATGNIIMDSATDGGSAGLAALNAYS